MSIPKRVTKYDKIFFLDSVKSYSGFQQRLTLLRRVHPKLKYFFSVSGSGSNTRFALYVRRWGA
jgi:hypothetical protein